MKQKGFREKNMNDIQIQTTTIIFTSISMFFANLGVVWWFRKESREDWKMIHEETKAFREAIRADMKDFHERLLDIEKKR